MIKLDFSTYQESISGVNLSETIAINLTHHALDRAEYRDGQKVGITKDDIEKIINKAEHKIIEIGQKYPTLIVKFHHFINIVGSLVKSGTEWLFQVITILCKKNFIAKNAWDKVVYVDEQKNTKKKKIVFEMLYIKRENKKKIKQLKDIILEVNSKPTLNLVQIIHNVEEERIKLVNLFEQFQVNTKVSYKNNTGIVKEVSHNKTSLLVEFNHNKKIRFYTNKRKKHKLISELCLI